MNQEFSAPSVFESFNARNLSPRQVAEGFIPPPRHFDDLISRRHSLVVGPRGSGKTTLLKMLQLPALAAWKHPDADRYRSQIDFTAIFVAADVSWGAQLGALAVRENYRSSEKLAGAPTRLERSRKSLALYTGSKSLFAIIEGNPRWFIGIVGPMIRGYKQYKRRIPRSVQARTITTATNRFRALLRTIPYHPPNSSASRGLLSLLDAIGEFLHNNLVQGPFNPDPPLSFVVDSNMSGELLEALGRALNAGAIILVPDPSGEALLSSLRGKRFRLSYMLAPGYGIPLNLGRPTSLSRILEHGSRNESQLNFLSGND